MQGEAREVRFELLFEEIDKLEFLLHSFRQHLHGCREVDDVLTVVVDGRLAIELEREYGIEEGGGGGCVVLVCTLCVCVCVCTT